MSPPWGSTFPKLPPISLHDRDQFFPCLGCLTFDVEATVGLAL